MKTRERILQTGLFLFNGEGTPHVTTVDIANEMNISPGNLYYHFKGKEVIIEALYHRFDEALTDILQAPLKQKLQLEDSWYYIYVVFEEMYHYRFIYHNMSDLLQRHEVLQKRFRRLLNLKAQTAMSMIKGLREANVLVLSDTAANVLVNNITMTMTFWLVYAQLRDGQQSAPALLHSAVFQVLSLLAPFLAKEKTEYLGLYQQFYAQALNQSEKSV